MPNAFSPLKLVLVGLHYQSGFSTDDFVQRKMLDYSSVVMRQDMIQSIFVVSCMEAARGTRTTLIQPSSAKQLAVEESILFQASSLLPDFQSVAEEATAAWSQVSLPPELCMD